MSFFKLALRNVFRQYGRTTLSMVSVVAGVFVIILGRGFVGGTNENIIRAQIDSVGGHVLVLPAGYPDFGLRAPVDELLTLNDQTRAWLDANTAAWTQRTFFIPRVIKGMDAVRVRAIGFDPQTDDKVFHRRRWRVDGEIPRLLTDGVLVAKGVARVLQLAPGDPLLLEARTAAGALNALQVPVAGVVATGNPMYDRISIFVPAPLVRELVRTGDGFSHLALRLRHRDQAAAVAAAARGYFGDDAEVRTWTDETESLLALQKNRQIAIDFIALMLMAIAAAGIANTVLMAAFERIREIGMLRAMGMTRAGVIRLFVSEGAVMGAIGSLLGALGGGLLVWRFSARGIDLSAMIETAGEQGAYDSIPMSTMLYMELSGLTIAVAVLFGLLVAVVASIYPALVASRLAPAEAVRAQ